MSNRWFWIGIVITLTMSMGIGSVFGAPLETSKTINFWAVTTTDQLPIAGDFDSDGLIDDIGTFQPSYRRWYFDYNANNRIDKTIGPWGLRGDLPIAGDFDRDGFKDDIGVFRPSTRMWYFDYDANGNTDRSMGPWGESGDMPIAGDFDGDGFKDDIGVFRPSTRMWYFDYDANGNTDHSMGPFLRRDFMGRWEWRGYLPFAGELFTGSHRDAVGVYNPSNRIWYVDSDLDGDTDETMGPWGIEGGLPVTGDFDFGLPTDGFAGDLGLFQPRAGACKWIFSRAVFVY